MCGYNQGDTEPSAGKAFMVMGTKKMSYQVNHVAGHQGPDSDLEYPRILWKANRERPMADATPEETHRTQQNVEQNNQE